MARRIKLVRARQALDLTQEQIAEQLEVDQSTVSRIERGEAIPSADLAAKLIRLLGVSLEDVIAPPTGANGLPAPDNAPPRHPTRKPRRSRSRAAA
jgi:transcriptional regulator with XRE-family HTH domain